MYCMLSFLTCDSFSRCPNKSVIKKVYYVFLSLSLHQPHTLLSLVNVHLCQGNLSGALAVFRRALTLTVHCPQCRASLPLMRCLQFYPFLYNLQHQACPCKYPPM